MLRKTLLLATCLALSACGGGGTPAPTNRLPIFTSLPAATMPENGTSAYAAAASDPDGSTVTFAISGGADAAAFRISPEGQLDFATAPDFERPTDADGNNVYQVQIAATDGTATTTQTVDVTVTNTPDQLNVRRVATGMGQSLAVRPYPDNSGRVAILEKAGLIRLLNPATGAMSLFLDVSASISTSGDRGLLGLAFAPDFATSRAFYVYLNTTTGAVEVRRYTVDVGNSVAETASADVILTFTLPSDSHQGGWLGFGPDNFLYIGTGDGLAGRRLAAAAFSNGTFQGKILRIDPSRDDFPADAAKDYAVPADNPRSLHVEPEIWVQGIRDLRHASFDPATKDLWFSDSGETTFEEIDRLRDGQVQSLAGAGVATNMGWNFYEGFSIVSPNLMPGGPECCLSPAYELRHDGATVRPGSIVGGYVYRGPATPLLGQYFFAAGANLYSFALSDVPASVGTRPPMRPGVMDRAVRSRNADLAPDAGGYTAISGFGTDAANNLYVLDSDGEVFIVEWR